MQKVKINIAGSEYKINTNRDPLYVKSIVKEINEKITSYMIKNETLTINHTLILLILEYIDKYKETQKSEDNLREQVNKYIEESMSARKEAALLRQELADLKDQI